MTTIADAVTLSRSIYDARAKTYEDSFHPAHAKNYTQWANFQPGQNVLDLACGTGLVSLFAKEPLGSEGNVTGIDISPGMLNVARDKSTAGAVDVEWIEWDINDLSTLHREKRLKVIAAGNLYDTITLTTALALIPQPRNLLSYCAKHLLRAHGAGHFVTDIPTESSHLPGIIFEEVAEELSISVPYTRKSISTLPDLENLFRDAGMVVEKSWRQEGYLTDDYTWQEAYNQDGTGKPEKKRVKSYDISAGVELFKTWITYPMYASFREGGEEVLARARILFLKRFEERAQSNNGTVYEEDAFYIIVARTT